MAAVRSKNTAPELVVRKLLHRLGCRFRLHRKDLPGSPDIVLPKRRCVVFVHGCFWHGHRCPRGAVPATNVDFWQEKIAKNRRRDRRNQYALRKAGWRVLNVWECETRNGPRLERRLLAFLDDPRM